MLRKIGMGALLAGLLLAAPFTSSAGAQAHQARAVGGRAPRVLAIHFALDINPITEGYLSNALHRAADQHYDAAVILLDTPGGLEDSERKIVQDELASPIPVIVYVSPAGARAASAGVWVSEAADLLAMAPESNIGSSTPISATGGNLGSDLRNKVINDAAASLRGLAASHGRNARWADAAVRAAANLTAQEALRQHVIDVTAPSLPALLAEVNGRRTQGPDRTFTLRLGGARVDSVAPGFFTHLLDDLIDPNLISVLFLAGIAGIVFEVLHPGVVLPGALGAVALLLSLLGFAILPPSWVGIVLLALAAILIVIDLHVTSHGALTVAGLICLVLGMGVLFSNAPPAYHVDRWLIAGIGGALGGFWALALRKAYQARHQPVIGTGAGRMIGKHGEVRLGGEHPQVFVDGELWRARSADDAPLLAGESVEVLGVEGLTLVVIG